MFAKQFAIRNEKGASERPLSALRGAPWIGDLDGRPAGGDLRRDERRRRLLNRRLTLHVFPWHPQMKRIGLQRNAAYLLRPDSYVALADSGGSASAIAAYLDSRTDASPVLNL